MKSKDKWVAREVGRVKLDPSQLVVVERKQLRGADFSGRHLLSFSSVGSRFESCRFDNTIIEDAQFGGGRDASEYVDCIFDGLRTNSKIGGFERFVRCSFRDCELREWFCFATEMVDCTFSGRIGAVFNGTIPDSEYLVCHPSVLMRLRGRFLRWTLPKTDRSIAKRKFNEFHGNDFSAADLVDCAFRTGIDLTQQRLPIGPDYAYLPDAANAFPVAQARVGGWDDASRRSEALSMLKTLEFELSGGQQQLFLSPSIFERHYRTDVVEAVLDLLRNRQSA